MAGNSTSNSTSTSTSSSNSTSHSNSNSKAPEKSLASSSKEEVKSPPSPPPSESKSSPPPSSSSSDSDSDSKSQSPPPPSMDSSPPPPPPSSPPPSPPPQSNNNDNKNNNNNNDNDKSSPSPPTPNNSPPSSSTSPSPPPPDNSSFESSPPSSPPPPSPASSEQSPPLPTPPNNANSGGGGDSGRSQSPAPPAVQQSPPASPENGGNPSVPAPPGAVPSTMILSSPSTPLFSPPTSLNNNQQSASSLSSSSPSHANHGSGRDPPSLSSSSFSSSSSSSPSPPVAIIAGVAAAGLLLLLLVVAVVCLRKKKKKKKMASPGMSACGWEGATSPPGKGTQYWQSPPQNQGVGITPSTGAPMGSGEDYSGQHSGPHHITPNQGVSPAGFALGFSSKSTFTYEELAAATNGFDQANMLGQGGFGYVHKGVLPDGKPIAVKSLKSGSGQGEREFQAEVEIISRVHHRHLVSLVGYCIAHGQRMLVYEFLPNDTLEYHLHKKREPILDFPTRLRIALGSAKGLAYLHEDCHPRIIHRDIKASNILLDEKFEAMVADFGLAKLTTDTNTHVSTRVMGTFGYLAPEYASSGKLTEKSDVFSSGVMLLELITGRRPVDLTMDMEDSLVDWSRPLLTKALEIGNYDELVDPRLEGNYNPQEMQRMVACAAASIRHSAKKRPRMSQIVRVLEGDVSLEDLNEGKQTSAYNSSDASSEYDTRAYTADLKKFRQVAFATQDFASSEYGGSTSDYGLNASSSSSSDSREMKL